MPKKQGDGALVVCDKKAQAWRLYLKRKSVAEIAEIMGISKRSVYRYVKSSRDKAVLDFEDTMAKDAGAEAKAMYDLIKRDTFEMIREAEQKYENGGLKYKDFAYIWNTLMDKVRLTQMSEDTLMGKTGKYTGDKASVTVNILAMPEEDAYGVVEKAMENPEFAQALCNLLDARGYQPAIEGEVKVLEDKEDDK